MQYIYSRKASWEIFYLGETMFESKTLKSVYADFSQNTALDFFQYEADTYSYPEDIDEILSLKRALSLTPINTLKKPILTKEVGEPQQVSPYMYGQYGAIRIAKAMSAVAFDFNFALKARPTKSNTISILYPLVMCDKNLLDIYRDCDIPLDSFGAIEFLAELPFLEENLDIHDGISALEILMAYSALHIAKRVFYFFDKNMDIVTPSAINEGETDDSVYENWLFYQAS
jgi:hypothetical protein